MAPKVPGKACTNNAWCVRGALRESAGPFGS